MTKRTSLADKANSKKATATAASSRPATDNVDKAAGSFTPEALLMAVEEQRSKLINMLSTVQRMKIAVLHGDPEELPKLSGALELLEDNAQTVVTGLDEYSLRRAAEAAASDDEAGTASFDSPRMRVVLKGLNILPDPEEESCKPESAGEGFSTARSDILEVLKSVRITHWGWLVMYQGTEAELRAAGVASPEMFADLGKTGVKSSNDGYGDKYRIQRRPKGVFELEFWLSEVPRYGDPLDEHNRKLLGWKTYGAECEAIVARALDHMRTSQKRRSHEHRMPRNATVASRRASPGPPRCGR